MFKKFNSDEISSHTQAKSSVHRNIKKKILELYPELGDTNTTTTTTNHNNDANATTPTTVSTTTTPTPTSSTTAVTDNTTGTGSSKDVTIPSEVEQQQQQQQVTPEIDYILPKKSAMYLIKVPQHIQLIVLNSIPLFFSVHDGPLLPTLRTLHRYPFLLPKWRCDKGAIRFLMNGSNVMCPGLTHPNAVMEDYIEKGKPVAIYIEGKQHAIAIGITTMSNNDVVKTNKGVCVEVYHHLGDGLWMTPHIDSK
jgi:PUA domain protein